MIELSIDDVSRLVAKVIVKKGSGYVYSNPSTPFSCFYVHDKYSDDPKPGCIVGHILHEAGGSLEDLSMREASVRNLLKLLEKDGILKVDSDARNYLIIIQALQDNKIPWGKADSMASQIRFDLL